MPFDDFDNDDFDFDDDDFDAEEFAKEFEQRSANAKSHMLYKQIVEVYETLKVLLDNANNENDYLTANKELLIESVFIIRAKLYSALQSDSYIVCMSNAAEIRKHADYLLLSSHTLNDMKQFDKQYISVFRNEMETFKTLFKTWAFEIKLMDKEDFEDEWGLF